MVKIFGKIQGANLTIVTVSSSTEDCIDSCFNKKECILAYMNSNNNCLQYQYKNVETIKVTEGSRMESGNTYVAFKTLLPSETCPSSYQDIYFHIIVNNETVNWVKTSNGWTFQKCRDGWNKFTRTDGVIVCMQVFLLQNTISRKDAKTTCAEEDAVLSGLSSKEELDWVIAKRSKADVIWIDGMRSCPNNDECQIFTWTDGYTQNSTLLQNADLSYTFDDMPENCLVAAGDNINDVSCTRFDNVTGVACGYRLS
uniref:C-type lectin domain-containing protein n=2 Tax=Caenorhabditis japonica TaxID=281687 RepID=A0A8R1HZB7_CAEJA